MLLPLIVLILVNSLNAGVFFTDTYFSCFDGLMHLSMLCSRGAGARDRVGTLIRNKNFESNFLTLEIRFQFKVLYLGEGFELNISQQTENFKPSEVKNVCLHLPICPSFM